MFACKKIIRKYEYFTLATTVYKIMLHVFFYLQELVDVRVLFHYEAKPVRIF